MFVSCSLSFINCLTLFLICFFVVGGNLKMLIREIAGEKNKTKQQLHFVVTSLNIKKRKLCDIQTDGKCISGPSDTLGSVEHIWSWQDSLKTWLYRPRTAGGGALTKTNGRRWWWWQGHDGKFTFCHLEPDLSESWPRRPTKAAGSWADGRGLFLPPLQTRVNRPTFWAASLQSLQLPCQQFVFLPTQGFFSLHTFFFFFFFFC